MFERKIFGEQFFCVFFVKEEAKINNGRLKNYFGKEINSVIN